MAAGKHGTSTRRPISLLEQPPGERLLQRGGGLNSKSKTLREFILILEELQSQEHHSGFQEL
ncbi:hypothetical protein EYF80_050039 [Liparis tanakae]|uniref:Uncharacterized protein n=1 Tax=Liparis tanakae TaxID=230148 RepID=A0A4Z2FGC8_9TELE|nr:hypothetical protein EYF80_050039 [Liparis tanakae]